jgi:hypothetical protein
LPTLRRTGGSDHFLTAQKSDFEFDPPASCHIFDISGCMKLSARVSIGGNTPQRADPFAASARPFFPLDTFAQSLSINAQQPAKHPIGNGTQSPCNPDATPIKNRTRKRNQIFFQKFALKFASKVASPAISHLHSAEKSGQSKPHVVASRSKI